MPRKGRARRFREARELKQGFDDGLFREGSGTLADVDRDADAEDDEDDEFDDEWDDDPLDDDPAQGRRAPRHLTHRQTDRRGSGEAGVAAVGVDVEAGDRLRTTSALIARSAPGRASTATTIVGGVDLEVAPQRDPRVGEAVAVGAERRRTAAARTGRSGRAPPSRSR